MTDTQQKKDYVVATCRVPVDLHQAVSRKLVGTRDSLQSLMLGALEAYVDDDREARPEPLADREIVRLAERFAEWAAKEHKGVAEQGIYDIVRRLLTE